MKKVLHILYSGLGGHGSVFFSLVKADYKHNFDQEAIFCGVESVREEYIKKCSYYNVTNYSLRKKPGFHPALYFQLYRLLVKRNPDIIFLHGTSFILPAFLYKLAHKNKRIIVRETQAHHLKTRTEWIWLRLAVRFSDTIVFLSAASRDDLFKKYSSGLLKRKSVIIPNGLDTSYYKPVEKNTSGKLVIGMQSRLQPIKDHPALLKAFALLVKRFPDTAIELRIAGDGETAESLKKLALDLGIAHKTEFCGMLEESDLLLFMHTLDIYVHATFGETMSNSIMQAMACGLPIIASDVWGVNNMVKNNETGVLYESENVEDLTEKLSLFVSDKDLRLRFAISAREQAAHEYSLDAFFKNYARLFNER